MRKRTKLAVGAGAALAVAGAGGALAAGQLSRSAESDAVVNDAARQLGVEPAKLSDALKQALENRLDEAVKAGTITKEQADRMRQRLESDDFPLFATPGLGHREGGHHGFGMRGMELDAAASYLGVAEAELRESLRDGKTLAEVARAEGKSVDGLVSALVAEATKRLDVAVKAGRLTDAQRDELVAGLKERVTNAVNGVRPAFERMPRGFGGPGGRGMHGGPMELPPAA
jgi:transposase-like protein